MTTLSSSVIAAGIRAGTIVRFYETVEAMLDATDTIADGEVFQAGTFLYEGAGSGATDHNLTNAGGSKIYVLPDETGSVNVMAFGAVGDGTTDDTAAFEAAFEARSFAVVRDEYATTYRVVIPPTNAGYYITNDLVIKRNIIIEGAAPHGRSQTGSKLIFSDACNAGFWFRHPAGDSSPAGTYEADIAAIGDGDWGSGRSILRNLHLEPDNAGMVDYGVIFNNIVQIENVHCQNFKYAGFFGHAQTTGSASYGTPTGVTGAGTMAGNINGSLLTFCHARDTTEGPGFAVSGNNAGIVNFFNCDANGNVGPGFRLDTTIGCHLAFCHTQGNTIRITHGGNYYMPIKRHTSSAALNEPGVGSAWEEYWVLSSATTGGTAWADATLYREAGGVNVTDVAGVEHTILGHYTEGGVEWGIIPRGATVIVGGAAVAGRVYLDSGDVDNVQIYGAGISNTPVKWEYDDGTYEAGASMGAVALATTFFQAGHTDDPDVTSAYNTFKITYSPVRNAYEITKDGTTLMSFPTSNWSSGSYSGKGIPFLNAGVIISGASTAVRLRGASSAASGPTGTVVVGDTYLYQTGAPGAYGMGRVTTAGTIGSTAVLKGMAAIEP